MYDEMDREYDYRDEYGRNQRDGRSNRGGDYRDDYRRGGRGRSNRMYRDRYGRSYRSDEYRECLEDLMEDTRESAREYEDVSEMATNSSDKQKLMKMAEREKEHHKYLKEMLENKM